MKIKKVSTSFQMFEAPLLRGFFLSLAYKTDIFILYTG